MPDRFALRGWASVLARLTELTLAALGLTYSLTSTTDATARRFLVAWDLLAGLYLAVGVVVVRRTLLREPRTALALPRWVRAAGDYRVHFWLTTAASITGFSAAWEIVDRGHTADVALSGEVKALAALAVLCVWLLIHIGYAHFYEGLYRRSGPRHGGMAFPGSATPNLVDFLYLAFTIGVSFAVSDVELTTREMRWHVLVHSVVSFFYNAGVLAIAIGVITAR
jgi:uncharacterized membrane protein